MRSLRDFKKIPKPKAILFDVDDTLVKYEGISDEEWYDLIWNVISRKFSGISKEDIIRMVNGELPRTFPERLGISAVEFWKAVDEVILERRRELAKRGMLRKHEDSEAIFKIDLPKAAISNASQEATEFSLKEVGLLESFSLILGKMYENLDACKPNPGQILYACEKMGISPRECWFVGNGKNDVIASVKAGCFPIQVLRDNVMIKEAQAIIPDLWKLLDLLEIALS